MIHAVKSRILQGPRILLAIVCAVILVAAVMHTGHSVESMDVRTYAQMIRGVAEHGLPYWDNGPVDRFPELIVPWGVAWKGHVWGIYGPLYPYLAAPVFRIGGLERVSSFTFAMLAPLAIVTFLLARRVIRDEWYAALAGLLCVVATPITAKAIEVTAFPLTAVLATLAVYFTVCLIELPRGFAVTGILCGVTWAAAGAAHALCFPMAMVALLIIGIAPNAETGRATWRTASARLLPTLAGFIGAILPGAYLNHLRFDSWNPISYGPIPWKGSITPEIYKMTLVHQVRYSLPAALFAVAVLVAAGVARARARNGRRWMIAVLVVAVAVAALVPALRERFVRYVAVALGYLVDAGFVELPYERPADGLGRVYGGWVAKSTLQCTPLLLLAPLALRGAADRRWTVIATLAPCAGLYASLVMRANLADVDALGWPWIYLRYTMAALPPLLVASLLVVSRLRPRVVDAAPAIVIGALLFVAFTTTHNDQMFAKRVALLILPLACAAWLLFAAYRAEVLARPSRLARAAFAVTIGVGTAIAMGHDLRANVDTKIPCDASVDEFARTVPNRFAFVGYLGDFDVLLSTTATHDVQYADLRRLGSFAEIRSLFDYWRGQGRPIYVLWGQGEPPNPWPDISYIRAEPVPKLFRVRFRSVDGSFT